MTTETKLEHHELSNLLPLMTEEEYQALKTSIKENGLQVPITRYEGKTLDGRHRARACHELGIEPKYVDFHENGVSAQEFVIIHNINRRSLTVGQKGALGAMIVAEAAKVKAVSGWNKWKKGNGDTCARVAKELGVCPRTVTMSRTVQKRDPKLFERLRNGSIKITLAWRKVAQPELKTRVVNKSLITVKGTLMPHAIQSPREAVIMLGIMKEKGWRYEMQNDGEGHQCHFYGQGGIKYISDHTHWSSVMACETFEEAIKEAVKRVMGLM